jgi:hypothetical protein
MVMGDEPNPKHSNLNSGGYEGLKIGNKTYFGAD